MIDTLKISKRLEAATFTKAQADAVAEAIAEVTSAELATGGDLAEVQLSLKADIKDLELRLTEKIIASERATRGLIFGAYGLIIGSYGLIVVGVFVNHFWR